MTTPADAGPGTAPAAGLQVRGLGKDLGGRTIVDDLDLDVGPGELICLLGPSGCGKTTTLRMIGGFLAPDSGAVCINGTDFSSASPDKRPTAMVFQNYALWPHMSVSGNIAFGLTLRKMSRSAVRDKVDWALGLVGLSHHRDTMPARISGGEQQRVALARALVLEPQVLLMDEPLSNLDAKLRLKVREDIRSIQQRLGITTVLVTHDQDEAMSMADRIAVMNNGAIEQFATPAALYASPATLFVAEFIGAMNIVGADEPLARLHTTDGRELAALARAVRGDRIGIRPEDVVITAVGERGTTRAEVARVIPRGHYQEVVLSCAAGTLRAFTSGASVPGTRVGVRVRRALVYAKGVLQPVPAATQRLSADVAGALR